MIKKKYYNHEMVPVVSIGIGIAVSLLLGLSGSALATYFIHSGALQLQSITWFAPIIHFACGAAGGTAAWVLSNRKKLAIPLIAVLGYMLALLCGHILLIDEKIALNGTTILSLVIATVVIVFIFYYGGEKRKYKYKKR